MHQLDYRALIRWASNYLAVPIIWILFLIDKIWSVFYYNRRSVRYWSFPERILIIKLVGIGDAVLMLKPIRAIRSRYPTAYIEVLASPLSAGVFYDEPSLDNLRVYDLFGSHRGLKHYIDLLLKLRKQNFDMVVDFEQHIKMVAVSSWLTGSRRRVGFAGPGNSRKLLLTDTIPLDGSRHMSDFYHELSECAGASEVEKESSKIFIDKRSTEKVEVWLQSVSINKNDIIVGMHTGSGIRAISRRWVPERFAMLANELKERIDVKIILTGSKAEKEDLEYVASLCDQQPFIGPHDSSVKELAYLISLMSVFISNDTGPMHIGPAMSTPTIALFGPQDPKRYGPVGQIHRTVYNSVPCSPCIQIHLGMVPECKMDNNLCIKNIEVADVLSQVLELLKISD